MEKELKKIIHNYIESSPDIHLFDDCLFSKKNEDEKLKYIFPFNGTLKQFLKVDFELLYDNNSFLIINGLHTYVSGSLFKNFEGEHFWGIYNIIKLDGKYVEYFIKNVTLVKKNIILNDFEKDYFMK